MKCAKCEDLMIFFFLLHFYHNYFGGLLISGNDFEIIPLILASFPFFPLLHLFCYFCDVVAQLGTAEKLD